jgi:hypothetical protein
MESLLNSKLEKAFGVFTLMIAGSSLLAAPSAHAPSSDSRSHMPVVWATKAVCTGEPTGQSRFTSSRTSQTSPTCLQELWPQRDHEGDFRGTLQPFAYAEQTLRSAGQRGSINSPFQANLLY